MKDLLLLLLFLIPILIGTCTQKNNQELGHEQIMRADFLREVSDQNMELRTENAELKKMLLTYETTITAQNQTLKEYFAKLRAGPKEVPNPHERIDLKDIMVFPSRVIIKASSVIPVMLTDTNSMDPVADNDSTVLAIKPRKEQEIYIGDIIGYRCSVCKKNEIIMHRVIGIEQDEKGFYYIVKGDNNPASDPDKVRFSQIRTVVVGIIY